MDFRNGFEKDDDAESGRGVLQGLVGRVQGHTIGAF